MSVGELMAFPFLKYFILAFDNFFKIYLVGNLVGAESNSSFLAEPTTTKKRRWKLSEVVLLGYAYFSGDGLLSNTQ